MTPVMGVENIRLFSMERDEAGNIKRVYSKLATRESERTVTDPDDDEAVAQLAIEGKAWEPGNTWEWAQGDETYDYALACESLPVVKLPTPDGMGMFEPFLDTLRRIDRQIFDRLCITMMQAFRQRAIKGDINLEYGPEDIEVIQGLKDEGDPIDLSERFAMGPAALWNLPDGVDIWESQTTDLNGLQNVINADIKHLAATAGIPLDILSPDVQGSANGAELKRETLRFKVENLNALASEAIGRHDSHGVDVERRGQRRRGRFRADVEAHGVHEQSGTRPIRPAEIPVRSDGPPHGSHP